MTYVVGGMQRFCPQGYETVAFTYCRGLIAMSAVIRSNRQARKQLLMKIIQLSVRWDAND